MTDDKTIIPVFIPPLAEIPAQAEQDKGSPLTAIETVQIRAMPSGEFDQALYNRVAAFVIKQTNAKTVNPETRLFQDLGIDGDDGDELIQQFCDQFNANIDNFYLNYHNHFGPELPWLALLWPYWILFKRDKLNKSCTAWKMIPISVIDLYNAAKAKEFPNLSTRKPE